MPNEPSGAADRLADRLMEVAGDQSVRALEALAAALANRSMTAPDDRPEAPSSGHAFGLCEPRTTFAGERYELCRRIARRALRGTLDRLVAGADAFHRIDADPPWACHLLPVAVFGSFLFYRTTPPRETLLPQAIGAQHASKSSARCAVERVLDVPRRGVHHGGE